MSVITYGLGALSPGDPAEIILQRTLDEAPTAEQIARKQEELGLNRPVPVQYASWLGGALRGDLGESWSTGQPVAQRIVDRLPMTALLALSGAGLAVAVGIPLGVIAAARRNRPADHALRVGALLGASLPNYFLAYLLILLGAVQIGWLPAGGSGSLRHLILPAVTLASGPTAILARLTRGSVLEVLEEDYVRTARAVGVPRLRLLFVNTLRNALLPVVTAAAMTMGALLNGAVIVEAIFSWPGLGQLGLQAIQTRDYPMMQGFVLFAAVMFVFMNLVADLLYGVLDPRVRVGERAVS